MSSSNDLILNAKLSLDSDVPLYNQLVAIIKRHISAGILVPGDLLPSESELCKALSISRSTVRQAIGALESEGLVVRRQGKGTFVAEPKVHRKTERVYSFTAWMRSHGKATYPPLELVPDIYLVVKLILNFKGWSTDPIILDYCIMLFALIFVVLGFYYSTGFLFDLGKPRLTLLFTLCACLFSAVAIVDGILDGSFATILEYLGFIAWLLPVVCAVSVPSAPDSPKTENAETSN